MTLPRRLNYPRGSGRFALLFAVALAVTAPAVKSHAVTRPLAYFPAGKHGATKVELRVDSFLVLRITCDGPRTLMFDFPKDESYQSLLPAERRKPLEFTFDPGGAYPMRTADIPHHRIGRLQLKPRFLRELDRSKSAWFWGPNDMGEAWPVMNLDALRRLAHGCSSSGRH